MSALTLEILERNRDAMSIIGSLNNFIWAEGEPFDAMRIVDDPTISLYCLDEEHQWAIFVVLPDEVDLSRVPFVYQAQFDHAQSLIAVPYSEFYELADTMTIDPQAMIWIHNIGRCGSTLMSQALNEIDDVVCLSEPDAIANFVSLRYMESQQRNHLLEATVKMLFRPAIVGNATRYVIKLRNQCTDIMDVFIDAFPQAKHLFMYRNVIDWLSSFHRLRAKHNVPRPQFTRAESIEQLAAYYNRSTTSAEQLFDPSIENYFGLTNRSISWLLAMLRYDEICKQYTSIQALRYEDLMSHRDAILLQTFTELDLPASAIQQAQMAFQRDSQAGTRLARDNAQSGNTVRLPDDEIAVVHQILSKQAVINLPDYVLSNTILP